LEKRRFGTAERPRRSTGTFLPIVIFSFLKKCEGVFAPIPRVFVRGMVRERLLPVLYLEKKPHIFPVDSLLSL
jgi:hypothetical protein